MAGLFPLLDTDGFPRRWHCGTAWQEDPALGWLPIGSDIAIWLAYMSIPAVLAYFVLRRRDVAFPRIVWLFVAFIFACGTGHLLEAAIFWWPVYRLSGLVKLFTATVSLATVGSLFVVLPQALNIPGMALSAQRLLQENDERRRAEQRLSGLNEQLATSMRELEQFNRLATNRELRMIELKREENALAHELGRREPYDLSFADSASQA